MEIFHETGSVALMKAADQIDELADLVQQADCVAIFTGAGISTECGIPDFRSPGGFWTRNKPIEFDDFLSSEEIRLEAWRRFLQIREKVKHARPGRGHLIVAELVNSGKANSIITQNIDGLHVSAGADRKRIIELHGNGTYAACLSCGERHELNWVKETIDRTAKAPRCVKCSGIVKAATISFGQPMPEHELARARAATLESDLFLAIGSSLQVYPATGLPVLAVQNRARLIIINREPTGLDGLARLVINSDIGDTLVETHNRLTLRIS
jgi:NAD-dependent deacetylase